MIHKRERTESKFEVITHALRLRKKMTILIFKTMSWNYAKDQAYLQGKIDKQDLTISEGLYLDKQMKLNEAAYNWFIEEERSTLIKALRDMVENITLANSIYAINIAECDLRRNYQDIAIGKCNFLLQELQYVVQILPLDFNDILSIVNDIEKEIALLKGWRTSDNKNRKKILSKVNSD